MRLRVERGVCEKDENPIRALLYLLLVNEDRKQKIESTPVTIGKKQYPPAPEKVIERIVRSITIKQLGESGYEYRFQSVQLECDLRVYADTRLREDWTFNPYLRDDDRLKI